MNVSIICINHTSDVVNRSHAATSFLNAVVNTPENVTMQSTTVAGVDSFPYDNTIKATPTTICAIDIALSRKNLRLSEAVSVVITILQKQRQNYTTPPL